jgi:hypothetical protein
VREALGELTRAAGPEGLGVRRRYNGRVHPGARYPAGAPRDSGRGTPCATTARMRCQ